MNYIRYQAFYEPIPYVQPCDDKCQHDPLMSFCANDGNPICATEELSWKCGQQPEQCLSVFVPCQDQCLNNFTLVSDQDGKLTCQPNEHFNIQFW